jgi:hypothetical protein
LRDFPIRSTVVSSRLIPACCRCAGMFFLRSCEMSFRYLYGYLLHCSKCLKLWRRVRAFTVNWEFIPFCYPSIRFADWQSPEIRCCAFLLVQPRRMYVDYPMMRSGHTNPTPLQDAYSWHRWPLSTAHLHEDHTWQLCKSHASSSCPHFNQPAALRDHHLVDCSFP